MRKASADGARELASYLLLPFGRAKRVLVAMAIAATFASGVSGCRSFARRCADKEVAQVLGEKDRNPDWKVENYHIYADPRARFSDPTNPDRPPMPPDDPAARNLSPNPQKPPHKAGVALVQGDGYLRLLAEWDTQNRSRLSRKTDNTPPDPPPPEQKAEPDAKTDKTDDHIWQASFPSPQQPDVPKEQPPPADQGKPTLREKDLPPPTGGGTPASPGYGTGPDTTGQGHPQA